MSTLSSANATDVNLVLKECTHKIKIKYSVHQYSILMHILGSWLIHHVSGSCWKGFQGQRSRRVKVVTRPNTIVSSANDFLQSVVVYIWWRNWIIHLLSFRNPYTCQCPRCLEFVNILPPISICHRGSTGPVEYFSEQLTSQHGRQWLFAVKCHITVVL